MLKRIKKAYVAFTAPKKSAYTLLSESVENVDEPLTLEKLAEVFNSLPEEYKQGTKGDGKAVFLPDMTEEEYDQYLEDEVNGWKKFKNKLGL